MAILASICKGLNEIYRSSHPGRSGGYFSIYFLCTQLAETFDTYKFDGEASSSLGMMKLSGLGRSKSFQLVAARELITFAKGFH